MKLLLPAVSYKTLLIKSVVFIIPWTIALLVVKSFWPELIELPKIVTNIFSNSIVFLLGYILTMIGFRYSERKSDGHDDEDSISARNRLNRSNGTNSSGPG